MSLKLVRDGTVPPDETNEPNAMIVSILEDTLELARRGEIDTIAIVCAFDGSIDTTAYGNHVVAIAGLEALKIEIIEATSSGI